MPMPLPLFATSSATGGATAKRNGHTALCPFFQPPHPKTFFFIAKSLATSSPNTQVTVFTPVVYGMYLYAYWDPVKDANLAFYPVGEWTSSSLPPSSPEEQLRVYMEEIGENMRSSMARAEEEFGVKITYVLADAFLADVIGDIAEERGVCWVAIWSSSVVASLAAYTNGDEIRLKSGVSLPESATLFGDNQIGRVVRIGGPAPIIAGVPEVPTDIPNRSWEAGVHQAVDKFLPGYPSGVPLLNLPHGSITAPENLERFPFAKMFHGMLRSLPKADFVIVNSFIRHETPFHDLLNPRSIFSVSRIIPLHDFYPPTVVVEDQEGIFPWLDSTAAGSVVYINLLGSAEEAIPPEREFHALAEALEATGVSFLWYMGPAWQQVRLLEGFVERTSKSGQGTVVKAALSPVRLMKFESDVIRHGAVGAQMRPSAWWTVEESAIVGKPIICRPVNPWFNQGLNSTLVRVWGIGVELEGWELTRSTAEKALRRVMLEEEGRRMKEKAAAMRKLAEEDAHGSSAKSKESGIQAHSRKILKIILGVSNSSN